MLIEIVNWAKYQPRHDIKSTSWFRLENTFWADPLLTPLDSDGKMVWIVLLAFASQRQSGRIEIDPKFISDSNRICLDKITAALLHFQRAGKIKIPTSRRKPKSRDATDGRTDETDETDGLKEERQKSGDQPSDPPPGDKSNLPKRSFTEADMKAATWLQKAVVFHNPAARKVHKANLERWADDFRLMREADGIDAEVIREALTRLFEPEHPSYVIDPFWRIQIQSPAALRKHWDKVTAVINNAKPKGGYAI